MSGPGWSALSSLVSRHPVAAFGIFFAVFPFLMPYKALASQVLIFGLFALGFNLLYGYTGLLSFGHAAYYGLGAYGTGIALAKLKIGSLFLGLAAGPLLAVLGGVVIGFFCLRRRGIYFAMLTLAFAQIVYAIVHQSYEVTGGDNGLLGVWPPRWLATPVRYYYWALGASLAGIALLWVVERSPFGLVLRAARDHARRAEAVGINLRAHQLVAFVVAGFFAGLAGAVFVFLKGSVFPVYVDVPMSVQPLVMVLLGGVGAFGGPAVGAVIYKLLDTVITRYTEYWQAVLGGILILLVTVFPRGLLGMLDRRAGRER